MDKKNNLINNDKNFLDGLNGELTQNSNYQLSDDERKEFFNIKNEYQNKKDHEINTLLKKLNSLEMNGVKIQTVSSLTDEIQGLLLYFMHHAPSEVKKSWSENIDKMFSALCDSQIKSDQDLIKKINQIIQDIDRIDHEAIQKEEIDDCKAKFQQDLQGILNKNNRKLLEDRTSNENTEKKSVFDDYFEVKLNQEVGISKSRFAAKKIQFSDDEIDVEEYKKIFLVKENIISKNDKGTIEGIVDRRAFEKVQRKYPIKFNLILIKWIDFILTKWMQYAQNLYNNFHYNAPNEEFISTLFDIYDEEIFYKIEKKEFNDDHGLDATFVEIVSDSKSIYKENEVKFDEFSIQRSFVQMYDKYLNQFDEASLLKAFQEAFIFGISDRINSGNLLEKKIDGQKTKIFNVDFGQLFDFQHNNTVKKFCNYIQKGRIDKAKKVFLNTWKSELDRKIFMRKTAQARPVVGIIFKKNREKWRELGLEIKKFNQIYSTLEHVVKNMSDEQFKNSFDFLCDKSGRQNLNSAIDLWNKFYEESGKFQINSAGKEIRYNVAQGLSELNKALEVKIDDEKEIQGKVKYWKDGHYLEKFFLSLALNIISILTAIIICKKFDEIKKFYDASSENKMFVEVAILSFILVASLSILSTIYCVVRGNEKVSEIFEKQSVDNFNQSRKNSEQSIEHLIS